MAKSWISANSVGENNINGVNFRESSNKIHYLDFIENLTQDVDLQQTQGSFQ